MTGNDNSYFGLYMFYSDSELTSIDNKSRIKLKSIVSSAA